MKTTIDSSEQFTLVLLQMTETAISLVRETKSSRKNNLTKPRDLRGQFTRMFPSHMFVNEGMEPSEVKGNQAPLSDHGNQYKSDGIHNLAFNETILITPLLINSQQTVTFTRATETS